MIYFIVDRFHNVKIGVSKDPQRRFENLITGNRYDFKHTITYRVQDDYAFEAEIHQILKHKNAKNEWFNQLTYYEVEVVIKTLKKHKCKVRQEKLYEQLKKIRTPFHYRVLQKWKIL